MKLFKLLLFLTTFIRTIPLDGQHAYSVSYFQGSPVQKVTTSWNDTALPQLDYGFTTRSGYSLVGSIVLIITGIIFVFYGYNMLKVTMFLAGAYFTALVTLHSLNRLQSSGTLKLVDNKDLVFFVVTLCLAILGGLAILLMYKLGLLLLGILMGYLLSLLLLGIPAIGNLLPSASSTIIFSVMLCFIVALLVVFLEKPVVIVSSAFVGSLALFLGIDYFVGSGFSAWFYSSMNLSELHSLSVGAYFIIAGFIIVGVIGTFVQYSYFEKYKK